jgi:hypothetical protein
VLRKSGIGLQSLLFALVMCTYVDVSALSKTVAPKIGNNVKAKPLSIVKLDSVQGR